MNILYYDASKIQQMLIDDSEDGGEEEDKYITMSNNGKVVKG